MQKTTAQPDKLNFGQSLLDLGGQAISGYFGAQTAKAVARTPQSIVVQAPAAPSFNPLYIGVGAIAVVGLVLVLARHH